MALETTAAHFSDFTPEPDAEPVDHIPIMLTAQLLGLVTGMALIPGLIPAAIMLVRAMV